MTQKILNINFKMSFIMEFLRELWKFLRLRRKLWLLPIIIIMMIFGGLLI